MTALPHPTKSPAKVPGFLLRARSRCRRLRWPFASLKISSAFKGQRSLAAAATSRQLAKFSIFTWPSGNVAMMSNSPPIARM